MENLNLTEIENSELNSINGGFIITTSMIVGAAIGALIGVALTQDLDNLADAFNEGRAAALND